MPNTNFRLKMQKNFTTRQWRIEKREGERLKLVPFKILLSRNFWHAYAGFRILLCVKIALISHSVENLVF